MSIKCEICGKEFKTSQGLRGHKTFVHQMSATQDPPARLATEQELIEVEDPVKQLVTLLKQIVDLLNKQYSMVADLTQYRHSIGEQAKKLTARVSSTETENRKLAQEVSKRHHDLVQLEIDLKRLSRYVQYEFAGIDNDIIWELCLDRPELKNKIKFPKHK